MSFLKTKVWPVFAGFVVASIAMMIFEFANSYLYPLPANLDWMDTAAVQAFTASLPWTAYILVILGWMAGSFKGGWVATRLSGDVSYRTALVLGVILTFAGIWNVMLLGHPLLFTLISIPQFLIFTYLGHRHSKRNL